MNLDLKQRAALHKANRQQAAEKAAATKAALAGEQAALVAKEQAAIDRLVAKPRRGVKSALGVSTIIGAKVLWVGRVR